MSRLATFRVPNISVPTRSLLETEMAQRNIHASLHEMMHALFKGEYVYAMSCVCIHVLVNKCTCSVYTCVFSYLHKLHACRCVNEIS